MTDTDTKPTVYTRLLAARERLQGEGEDGLQAWYREEISVRTGWTPSKSTVHRYVHGETALDDRARTVLEELEEEAAEADPFEAPEEIDLPDLGAKRERNALLVADFIRGATLRDLGESYGISHAAAGKIVERAEVRRLDELTSAEM